MKFKAKLLQHHGSVWGQHIMVPPKVSDHFAKLKIKRLICTINNAEKFHCAILPIADGTRFININKQITKKLKLGLDEEVDISLKKIKANMVFHYRQK